MNTGKQEIQFIDFQTKNWWLDIFVYKWTFAKRTGLSVPISDNHKHVFTIFFKLTNLGRLDTENGSGGRDKREGFVDLDALPHAMRGFANNIGKGFSSMVHRGNSHGQKYAKGHPLVNPTVYYGNWKPIYPTDPNYSKPHNSYNSVKGELPGQIH